MLLSLQKGIIYGPVRSRRLGRSLGINILPPGRKVCSFNCVYCQYGWAESLEQNNGKALDWPSTGQVGKALEEALLRLTEAPDYITFSGNGEATLHPCFPEMVDAVTGIRNRIATKAKTAILSNSSLAGEPHIQETLEKLDCKIMKLDCGSKKTFAGYNRPAEGISLDEIMLSLEKLSAVTIQALFSKGSPGNLKTENVRAWIERLIAIRPVYVQIYSLDRDAPHGGLRSASPKDLAVLKARVNKAGIPAGFY